MTIDKYNYQQWMKGLEEGVLTDAEEALLIHFLTDHPDLLDESMLEYGPTLIEEPMPVMDKSILLKSEDNHWGMDDFDYLSVKSMEEGLNKEDEVQLSCLISEKPELQYDYDLYQKLHLRSDVNIVYPAHSELKHEIHRQITIKPVIRYAAAAAVLFGAVWFFWPNKEVVIPDQPLAIVSEQPEGDFSHQETVSPKSLSVVQIPIRTEKTEQPKVTDSVAIDISRESLNPMPSKGVTVLQVNTDVDALAMSIEKIETPFNSDILNDAVLELAAVQPTPELRHREDRLSLRIIQSGVMVANLIGINSVKLSKSYNDNGEVVAYRLKGDNFQWDQKVK